VNQTLIEPKDFLNWKTQVISHLMSHGLFSFVDGSITPPNPITYDASGNWHRTPIFITGCKLINKFAHGYLPPSLMLSLSRSTTFFTPIRFVIIYV